MNVFNNMEAASDGNELTFAQGIMTAIANSFTTGSTVGTVYLGACSLGTSPGTVASTSSTISAAAGTPTAISGLNTACNNMEAAADGSDAPWIDAVVNGCTAIVTAANNVTEVLAGTVIPPSTPPPTVPAAGSAMGTFVDAAPKTALKTALTAIPAAMGTTGDNSILANGIATAVLTYFAAMIYNGSGSGPLAGLTGVGAMVGNT
jgi:hypothetical protein